MVASFSLNLAMRFGKHRFVSSIDSKVQSRDEIVAHSQTNWQMAPLETNNESVRLTVSLPGLD